jgi:hypothetical protein
VFSLRIAEMRSDRFIECVHQTQKPLECKAAQ